MKKNRHMMKAQALEKVRKYAIERLEECSNLAEYVKLRRLASKDFDIKSFCERRLINPKAWEEIESGVRQPSPIAALGFILGLDPEDDEWDMLASLYHSTGVKDGIRWDADIFVEKKAIIAPSWIWMRHEIISRFMGLRPLSAESLFYLDARPMKIDESAVKKYIDRVLWRDCKYFENHQ